MECAAERSLSQCGNVLCGEVNQLRDEGPGMCGVLLTVWPQLNGLLSARLPAREVLQI